MSYSPPAPWRRLDHQTRPAELITECLDIALQAPSGSEPRVALDRGDRAGPGAAIGEFYRRSVSTYLESAGAAGKLFADDPDRAVIQRRVGSSVEYLAEHMGEVPVLVLPSLWVGDAGLPKGNQAGLWGSVLPAAWSYMLAARARGLGTAWTTLHLAFEREVAALLGLPQQVRQGVLIPTAFYTGDSFARAAREPLERVLHVNGW
jgi:nitroreductase